MAGHYSQNSYTIIMNGRPVLRNCPEEVSLDSLKIQMAIVKVCARMEHAVEERDTWEEEN